MDEKLLRSRLKRLTVIAVLISIAIMAGTVAVSLYVRNMLEAALTEQIQSEAEQYRIHIRRQMYADLQSLDTLAGFLQYSQPDRESFVQGFLASKQYNDFEYMGDFDRSDERIRVMIGPDALEDNIPKSVDEAVREAVEGAWDGEDEISRIYRADGEKDGTFAYAVPIFDGDTVVGALAASVSTETFREILDDNSILRGQGYIHMISGTGEVLVRSQERGVEEEPSTVFGNGYITPKEEEKIKTAMASGKRYLSELTYKGVTYQIFLEPVGVNGWYLFYVQTAQGISESIYRLMVNTRLATVAVIFILLLIIIYSYRLIYQSNRRLIRSAYYDSLTGAYNMTKFLHEISPVIEKSYEYSLAAMNVRQFKFINEIFGHREADALLCQIKKVIGENLSEGEYYCRSSEDMFYILFRDTKRQTIRSRLERMVSEIGSHAVGSSRDYQVRIYCGVVIGTEVKDSEPTAQKALTHVRFAMDTAQTSIQDSIRFYDMQLHEDEKLENYVESHMEQALENREFKMYLQPKIKLSDGSVGGAEALVRWIPESGDVIYPGQFIPIFEKNGFCTKLDMYMVEEACRQIRLWIDEKKRPVPLSVNQSKLLFYDGDYIDNLKALLDRYQISANLITLEILEGLAFDNTGELKEKIGRLREIGFKISMDDFGSGYSSLNTLASLKIDELKFDREFLKKVKGVDEDCRRQIIIMENIVQMTKKLNISTVVEGVETKGNDNLIRAFRCDYGQGYYYSKPLSAEEFSEKYVK